jgi:hypothetical protein
MRYRTIGSDAATQRSVSVLSLGAMLMGSRTDEATSFAILDRFVEAGGPSSTRRGLRLLGARSVVQNRPRMQAFWVCASGRCSRTDSNLSGFFA